MPRPKKPQQREIVSLSLPPDMAAEISKKAGALNMTKAEYVRTTMTIGMTVKDDIATLARAVRDIRSQPQAYSLSTRLTLWQACNSALDNYSSHDAARILPGDKEELELFVKKVGPYRIATNGWVCGPFKRKEYGEVLRYQIDGPEPYGDAGRLIVPFSFIELPAKPLEWTDGSLYWVYTNAEMTTEAVKIFQDNIQRTWNNLGVEPRLSLNV